MPELIRALGQSGATGRFERRGRFRITAELREDGERVNHKRIARVVRSIGLAGLRLRRRHRTTVSDPAAAKAPDLICRDFTGSDVNTKRRSIGPSGMRAGVAAVRVARRTAR
ncbi:IS3 family transposase [Streptomyces sp. NPDC090445]|uniref:IS3 family transposase n=1 Tax=Streptomyces sp. NPDC090445 TaxID=3365963 RepID=UPI0037F7EEFA